MYQSFKNLAVIKPAVDIFDPSVVRSTMGALFKIHFRYFNTLEEYVKKYEGHTNYLFMLDGAENILDVDFKKPFSLIQGNEGKGLDESYRDIGQSVYIPHSDEIDSLNLSVATSIGMWECSRREVK